jgi:replication-associated recombination protein RarA
MDCHEVPLANPFIENERGYDGLVLVSALHKDIRRAHHVGAAYWTVEMLEGGWSALLFSRLRIILHEDCGVADPIAFLTAQACLRDFREMWEGKKTGWRLAMANTILAMCNARKCRDADFLVAVVLHARHVFPPRSIPDYALDHHTAKGKSLGRTEENFGHESYLLRPEDLTDSELKRRGEEAFAWEKTSGRSLTDPVEARPAHPSQRRLEGNG